MIAHALTIVRNEMERHLAAFGGPSPHTELGNPADVGVNSVGHGLRDLLLLSVVTIRDERASRNLPDPVIEESARRVPPSVLNLSLLVCATHSQYPDALTALSRAVTFLHATTVFTPQTVDPQSLVDGAPTNQSERLTNFRLVVDLRSPSFEEANSMWGMLGGRQYPFALYSMRILGAG